MKYYILAAFSILSFAACNSSQPAEDKTATKTPAETPAVAQGPKDPVCDMVKDNTWTEYSVSGTDTTWFCSETCKTAYEGNPQKYMSKPAM